MNFLWRSIFFTTAAPLKKKGAFRKGVLTTLTLVTFKMVKWIYIWYLYDVYIPLNMGGGSAALWHRTYGHIHILLTSTQKVDNRILVQSHLNCRETRVLRNTGNIGTSPPLSISLEVWDKPIMLIGTWLGASFTIFCM